MDKVYVEELSNKMLFKKKFQCLRVLIVLCWFLFIVIFSIIVLENSLVIFRNMSMKLIDDIVYLFLDIYVCVKICICL